MLSCVTLFASSTVTLACLKHSFLHGDIEGQHIFLGIIFLFFQFYSSYLLIIPATALIDVLHFETEALTNMALIMATNCTLDSNTQPMSQMGWLWRVPSPGSMLFLVFAALAEAAQATRAVTGLSL